TTVLKNSMKTARVARIKTDLGMERAEEQTPSGAVVVKECARRCVDGKDTIEKPHTNNISRIFRSATSRGRT
ncbi:hypothetical protein PRIPAC_92198, partial [Pristionchus pacificus]